MDLRITNPAIPFDTYRENRMLYEGFADEDSIKANLTKHPFESNKQYEIRLKRAVYRNFIALIVNVFSSAIFGRAVTRELPDSCEQYKNDVNKALDGADVYFQHVADEAASLGVNFVLVSKSASTAATLSEEKADGVRPYFVTLAPEQVLDFGIDSDSGEILYVTITYSTNENGGMPGNQYKNHAYYEVWDRQRWTRYEALKQKSSGKLVFEVVSEGSHDIGEVPVVPFYFRRDRPMVGRAAVKDIVALAKKLFRLDSEHDKQLFDAAVAFLFVAGVNPDDIDDFVKSSSNALTTMNTDAKASYVETTGTSFEAIRTQIKDTEDAIRELALRVIRPATKGVESAESRKLDKQPLNSMLSVFSRNTEDAEAKCWYFMDRWQGGNGDGIAIKYDRDFSYEELTDQLLRALEGMTMNRTLSKETLYKILMQRGILPGDFDPITEAQLISREGFSNPSFSLPA